MKKIIIIGGGIAGLSAGIYALKSGYEAEIYEKNPVPGGNCSGWKRGDYYIDNCIHWMSGTKTDTAQNKIWHDVGALGDHVSIIKREAFYSSELNGDVITLWRDTERTLKEMLELSPEDEKPIKQFIKYVQILEKIQTPMENTSDMINVFRDINTVVSGKELIGGLVEYGRLSLETLAKKFRHPLLQKVFLDFMAKEYESYWLIIAYAIFTCDNGDIPSGGSMGIVNNMCETFRKLGGKIYTNSEVECVRVNKKKFRINKEIFDEKSFNLYKVKRIVSQNADGIRLKNGKEIDGDYIICACDINYTFDSLLKRKYAPKQIRKLFSSKKNHRIYSSYQVAFSVEGIMEEINDTLSFDCEPIDVGKHCFDRITVKNYRIYGDYIAPEGHTVIQCSIVQYKEDYAYWNRLHKNIDRYNLEKRNIAQAVCYRIEQKFPKYSGKIHILDSWTPVTYATRNNNYCGAYMRYITTIATQKAFLPCDIKRLGNVFLASHWLRYPGGIPTAATMGKVAIERIDKLAK